MSEPLHWHWDSDRGSGGSGTLWCVCVETGLQGCKETVAIFKTLMVKFGAAVAIKFQRENIVVNPPTCV